MSLAKVQGRNESMLTLMFLTTVFAAVLVACVGLFNHTAQMQNLKIKQINGVTVSMLESTK
jgi:hypothetical protein